MNGYVFNHFLMQNPEKRKSAIASSFPEKYEEGLLDYSISADNFSVFEKGFFADSMDDKWNFFVLGEYLYFARSWTDFCIYKVAFVKNEQILLKNFRVNRDKKQYRGDDLEHDKELLLQLIQMFIEMR
jgi:hypothetical protein